MVRSPSTAINSPRRSFLRSRGKARASFAVKDSLRDPLVRLLASRLLARFVFFEVDFNEREVVCRRGLRFVEVFFFLATEEPPGRNRL